MQLESNLGTDVWQCSWCGDLCCVKYSQMHAAYLQHESIYLTFALSLSTCLIARVIIIRHSLSLQQHWQ